MHINAQVTAVIMMLEFLGNFHIVVIFMEWGELTRFLISYFFMLLHFLVLSYAHLKNTRGNKNRIIQYGWANVFKNILGIRMQKIHPLITHRAVKPNDANVVTNPEAQEKDNVARTTSKIVNEQSIVPATYITSIICDDSNEKINQAGIRYTKVEMLKVSGNGDNQYLSRAPEGLSTNISKVSENESCDTLSGDGGSCSIEYTAQKGVRCSEKTYRKTRMNDTISQERSKILNSLQFFLCDEPAYIKRLRCLVELERLYKNHEDIHTFNYDNMNNYMCQLPHFVGSVNRKLEMRTSILHKLQHFTSEDEIFEEYFEHFMDMEEDFLENGC